MPKKKTWLPRKYWSMKTSLQYGEHDYPEVLFVSQNINHSCWCLPGWVKKHETREILLNIFFLIFYQFFGIYKYTFFPWSVGGWAPWFPLFHLPPQFHSRRQTEHWQSSYLLIFIYMFRYVLHCKFPPFILIIF